MSNTPSTIIGNWKYTLHQADHIYIDWCGPEGATLDDQGYHGSLGGHPSDITIDDCHAPTEDVLKALGVTTKVCVDRNHGWAIYSPEGWLLDTDNGDSLASHHEERPGTRIVHIWSVEEVEDGQDTVSTTSTVGGAL